MTLGTLTLAAFSTQKATTQQESAKSKNLPLDVCNVSRQILVDGQDPRLGDDELLEVGVGARARNGLAWLENRARDLLRRYHGLKQDGRHG